MARKSVKKNSNKGAKKVFQNNKITVYLTSELNSADKIKVTVDEMHQKLPVVKLVRLTPEQIDEIMQGVKKPNHIKKPNQSKMITDLSVRTRSKTRNIHDKMIIPQKIDDSMQEVKKPHHIKKPKQSKMITVFSVKTRSKTRKINDKMIPKKFNDSMQEDKKPDHIEKSSQSKMITELSVKTRSKTRKMNDKATELLDSTSFKRKSECFYDLGSDIKLNPAKKRKCDKQCLVQDSEPLAIAKESSHALLSENKTIAEIDFKVGGIVWAKIKGFPHWPAEIITLYSNKMVEVVWFNDYRKTKIYKTQMYKFLENFENFTKESENTIGLRTAAQEAMMCYASKQPCKRMF